MIIPSDILHGRDGRSIVVTTAPASSGVLSRAMHEISGAAAKSAAPSRRVPHLMARYLGSLLASREKEMTEEECHPQPNIDLCEKQSASSHIDIIVPVCIVYVPFPLRAGQPSRRLTFPEKYSAVLLIGLFAVLFYFHVRRQKRDEAEWSSKNNHEMEDYGIEPVAPSKAHSRR